MRLRNRETPTFAGAAGSSAAIVEVVELLDHQENVLATFTKAVDGTFSHDLPASAAVSAAIAAALSAAGQRTRVRAATTANVTISTALNNTDTLDGVTLATGDLVLVKDQSSAAENGIYVVGAIPARHSEFDTYDEHPGSLIIIEEGTINADTIWFCSSNVGGTLASTAIAFTNLPIVSVSDTAYNATSWDAVTTVAPSKNAVRDKIETLQSSLLGTFSLANFTDPGDATASAALTGTIGTLIFGYVTYTPNTVTAQQQLFAIETAVASGSYTTAQIVGQANNAANVGGAETKSFCFFVPTGRKWKHTVTGTAAITSISAVIL